MTGVADLLETEEFNLEALAALTVTSIVERCSMCSELAEVIVEIFSDPGGSRYLALCQSHHVALYDTMKVLGITIEESE